MLLRDFRRGQVLRSQSNDLLTFRAIDLLHGAAAARGWQWNGSLRRRPQCGGLQRNPMETFSSGLSKKDLCQVALDTASWLLLDNQWPSRHGCLTFITVGFDVRCASDSIPGPITNGILTWPDAACLKLVPGC